MAEISIPYGEKNIGMQFPGYMQTVVPRIAEKSCNDWDDRLTEALDKSFPSFEDYIKCGDRILLIIPDITRKCGLKSFLPQILARLRNSGISRNNITILIACGTHKNIGIENYRAIVGDSVISDYRVIEHNCDGPTRFTGMTSRGTSVEINSLLFENDRIMAIGGTLPHYFAGFGGGPKLIFPGCAGRKGILDNHRLSIHFQDGYNTNQDNSGQGLNELMKDILEAVSFLPQIYHVGIILDNYERPYEFYAGELIESYKKMAASAKQLFSAEIRHKADLVIASAGGYPKDIDLLQSHKSILHASAALETGGILIAFAECSNGIGSPTLSQLIEMGSYEKIETKLKNEYILNGQAALSLFRLGNKFRVKLITSLDENIVKKIGFEKVTSKTAEEITAEFKGKKGYYLPQSANTIVKSD